MLVAGYKYWESTNPITKLALLLLLLSTVLILMSGCANRRTTDNMAPKDITLLGNWSGNYPVSDLDKLSTGQQDIPAGYIGDTATFIPVWRAFMPTEILPAVDFRKNIVVFTRNTRFYNRKSIITVTLQNGIAEIIAMETRTAMPIEEKVAMAMAVIPREGVMAIQAGDKKIQVLDVQ